MNKLLTFLALGISLSLGAAHAADTPASAPAKAASAAPATSAPQGKGPHGQQNKMKSCNQDAGEKKGDERKDFMKECLKKDGPPPADAKPTQQNKMKMCNQEAGDKKGDDRKAFMKECLSAKKPDATPEAKKPEAGK